MTIDIESLAGDPTAPTVGRVKIYTKAKEVFAQDEDGLVTQLGVAASGDVVGPGLATDSAVALFDGTTGALIKNSVVIIDGSGNITGAGNITATLFTGDLTGDVNNVTLNATGAATAFLNETGSYSVPAGTAGDFVGPGVSVANNFVSFADTTGKLGADSGFAGADFLQLAGGTMSGAINMGAQAITNAGAVTSTGFSGPLTGNVTGDVNSVTLNASGAATAFLNETGAYTVPAGAAATLQDAYGNGQAIAIAAATGTLIFNATDAVAFEVQKAAANVIAMSTTGAVSLTPPSGAGITMTTAGAGDFNVGSNNDVLINAVNDLRLRQASGDRLVLGVTGTVDITPLSGQDFTVLATGDGNVIITGGVQTGVGGTVSIAGGSSTIDAGADATFAGGAATTNQGGGAFIVGGGSATGSGGDASVIGGAATAGTQSGGSVILEGGASAGGSQGSVTVNAFVFPGDGSNFTMPVTTGAAGTVMTDVAGDGVLSMQAGPTGLFLPLAGGTMAGAINMGAQAITNAGAITSTGFLGPLTGDVNSVTLTAAGDGTLILGDNGVYKVDVGRFAGATGWLEGGLVTAATATTVNVTEGSGRITDYSLPDNPVTTEVTWEAELGVVITAVATTDVTLIAFDSTGTLVQFLQSTVTRSDFRTHVFVGEVGHSGGAIEGAGSTVGNVAYDGQATLGDFLDVIGPTQRFGVEIVANVAANLTLDHDAGELFIANRNVRIDPTVGDLNPITAASPLVMRRVFRDNLSNSVKVQNIIPDSNIDPTLFDDGSGTLQAVAANDWTNQRIFVGSGGTVLVGFGQETYNTQALAVAALTTETFVEQSPLSTFALRAFLTVKGNATDLTDAADAKLTRASKFRVFGTSGGGVQAAGSFLALTDTPAVYTSEALRGVRVNAGEAGLEFADFALEALTLTAGGGLTGGGDLSVNRTFNVVANGDGSIVVNPDDIQVGVLATDAQHGLRGGGTQHDVAIASGAAGFISGTSQQSLDDFVAAGPFLPLGGGTMTGAIDMGAQSITNAALISSLGDLAITPAAGQELLLSSAGETTRILGDFVVDGTRFISETETILLADNHINLNTGYTVTSAQTGGLVVNYLPTATADTVNGVYVAGIASTSNPTVVTTGAATFATGDFVQFSAGDDNNDGVYEVLTHVANLLTVRGIGTAATVEDFTQNQFEAGASDGATITVVNVSVMRAGTTGVWEQAAGATSGLTFTQSLLLSGGTMTGAINMGTNAITNAGAITSTGFSGPLSGNVTGDVNTVTILTDGPATQFLDRTGNYSTPAGTGGEANTASNAGTVSLVLAKSGVDLPFRGLLGINNIGVAINGNNVEIDGTLLALSARNLIAGAGLTGGGDLSADRTFNVVANVDASIVVNANNIQVGILATDAQHGLRGGGTQHTVAVASGAAGFISGASQQKLDDLDAIITLQDTYDNGQAIAMLAATGTLVFNATDAVAFQVQKTAANVIAMSTTGAVDITPTSGQDFTLTATGDGNVTITGGVQTGIGGAVSIAGGSSTVDAGADATLAGGAATGNTGGVANLVGGTSDTGTGGDATVIGGATTAGTQNGGTVLIEGGGSAGGAQGSVTVNAYVFAGDGANFTMPSSTGAAGTVLTDVVGNGVLSFQVSATTIGNLGSGTLAELNAAITDATLIADTRTLTAGNGLTGGGDLSANRTFTVVAGDASITVNANDITVGILQTDAQHGLRGGGTQHANVIAAGAAGFMTGADKAKLDGIEALADVTDAANVATAGAAILIGQAGGQVLQGGTASGDDLTLESTSNATKGDVILASGSALLFNDQTAPANPLAGQGRLYKKTGDDGIFWLPDAAGPEVDLTAAGGEVNTASNQGTISLVLAKSGVDLPFRGLNGINGITTVINGNNVDIDGTSLALGATVFTAGAGLTGGGDLSAARTFDVVANADASIVVNANDIQVGVLATDAQHGLRGGGTQHAVVIAAGADGFMTGADKTKLDGIEALADVTDTANVTSAGAAILAGQSGGQTLIGGTASGDDLSLASTSNATKGDVIIVDGVLLFPDVTAPSNPLAAQGRLYKKTGNDGLFWLPDAAGPEVDLTTAVASNEFSDALFRIQDNGDVTKELAFEVSAITTATTRTITIPDADTTLYIKEGLSGGQILVGDTAANGDLTLESTSNVTKGSVILAAGTNLDLSDEDVINAKTITFGDPDVQTTSGATLTIDFSSHQKHRITMASNITTVTIIDPPGAGNFTVEFVQNGTGLFTLTGWPANVFWLDGIDPVLGDAANARRLVSFYYNGTTEDDYYGEFNTGTYS